MLKAGIIRALGTMSGTSLDGVDAAMITTDGEQIFDFGPVAYRPYSDAERVVLRAHLGRWPSDDVTGAAKVIEKAHIAVMSGFDAIDLAGFHGQTLAHDPGGRGTHQCGNGARIADALGCPVVWDFRSEDMRQGGQGAPLAPFYHFALARRIRATAPVAFLNLGGVGNLTWIDPGCSQPQQPDALLAFDTGPANAPINDLMQARLGLPFDEGGALALAGRVNQDVIDAFLAHSYFDRPPPKSLARDAFAGLVDAVSDLSDADAVATLTQAVIASVCKGVQACPTTPASLLVTGGGRKNAALMAGLAAELTCDVIPVERAGLDGDMLEAQAFAYLAVRVARGLPTSAPGTTGAVAPVCSGKLSAITRAGKK